VRAGGGPAPGRRGALGLVRANSPAHWALLVTGLAGSVLFNLTWFVDGLIRSGYDPVVQPVSALSLGPGGWVQVANFAVFGAVGVITAPAWRPTLAGGTGAVWYPRVAVLAGAATIGAAVFSQDPALGYPPGAIAPLHPSAHAQVHNVVAYISLIATIAQLVILARRFRREPRWRGWAAAALVTACLMVGFLAAFGILISHGGPGGTFEKLASLSATVFGISLISRLIARRDARISAPPQAE
jgi:hypothetical protein